MTGCGRYPPQPWHKPIQFYGCARLGNPELLKKIMETDPYFITQDNGAGSPLHFATTYKQLDMVGAIAIEPRSYAKEASTPSPSSIMQPLTRSLTWQGLMKHSAQPHLWNGIPASFNRSSLQIHYLLNLGAEINQRDDKGFTPLHRAAYLAQYDGYLEIYEYLLVRIPLS